MNLQPTPAGCVFGLATLLPAIPFVVLSGARDPLTVGLIVVAAMGSGIAFALRATVAGRPHSPKSIILALLGCWSFFSSTNWLAHHHLAEIPWFPWVATMIWAIQTIFVFLIGWRFAPRGLESADG